jgi:hypothetical protein
VTFSRWLTKILPLFVAVSALTACSERYREADAGRSAEEIEEFLSEIRGRTAVNGTGTAAAFELSKDQTTTVFFSESSNSGTAAMGPIHTVVPIDFNELGIDTNPRDMEYIRVYFLENATEEVRKYALMIDVKKTGEKQPKLYVFVNNNNTQEPTSFVEDGVFEVSFSLTTPGSKLLILRSNDTDEDAELMDVVQFQASVIASDDSEFSIGQISSMVGFR